MLSFSILALVAAPLGEPDPTPMGSRVSSRVKVTQGARPRHETSNSLISVNLSGHPGDDPATGRQTHSSKWQGAIEFREAILSWNASALPNCRLEFKIRAAKLVKQLTDEPFRTSFFTNVEPGSITPWYTMGIWSTDALRTSIEKQKNASGDVLTDTLRLAGPLDAFQIQVDYLPADPGWIFLQKPDLNNSAREISPFDNLQIWVCLSGEKQAEPPAQTARPIETLEIPQRFQLDYPDGQDICSPTSLSMVLGYWATKLGRPPLDRPVPEVCRAVKDAAYGYGNWSFNTAYAGSQPGIRSYVTRFDSISELEQWVAREVPVVCSVSYAILKGKGKKEPDDGHLVTLVGFDSAGDPVFNDPGRKVVRMTYKRSDFDAAWRTSGRTVYLVYPKTWSVPEDRWGHWSDENGLGP